MLSAAVYGLFFTIAIIAIIVCILTIEKLWSKKERLQSIQSRLTSTVHDNINEI